MNNQINLNDKTVSFIIRHCYTAQEFVEHSYEEGKERQNYLNSDPAYLDYRPWELFAKLA
jgi:hypothetical protein